MRMLNKTEREKKKIIEMWTYCFSDPPEFIDWNFSRNFEPDNTFVAERDGEIAANLQLIPYKASIMGEMVESVYFSGVATMPQYRSMGCARELMCESIKMLKVKKIPIAHLIPFKFSFYEKFGFKAVAERYTLNIPLDKITYNYDGGFKLYNGMDEITDTVIANLDRIYCGMCGKLKFYIKRSVENHTKILEDIILNSRGYLAMSDESYILYGIEGEKISVYELGYSTPQGFRNALGFLKMHSAERRNTEIVTLFSPLIKTELCDIKNIVNINPLAMLRIIDAEYILDILARKYDSSFVIRVRDDIIDENNACFKIQSGAVLKSEENADITVSISELSQLICGYISLEEAYEIGAVEVRDKKILSELENVFGHSSSYMNLML